MKFLFDTNAIIPAEPTDAAYAEPSTPVISELIGLIEQGRHQIYLHPASFVELRGDKNHSRLQVRNQLLRKYVILPTPPRPSEQLVAMIGEATRGSHDEIDNYLLAAVYRNAVDFLITNDQGILKKAKKAALFDRVLSPEDAAATVRGLFRTVPEPPTAVKKVVCHELDEADPIFKSIRQDYQDFDVWFRKSKLEHRGAWIIQRDTNLLAGLCIVKDESSKEYGLDGQLLKLCTFKISEHARGFRYGELLLKSIFHYVFANKYDWIYVEIFEKYREFISLLEEFGFITLQTRTIRNEVVLAKPADASLILWKMAGVEPPIGLCEQV